MRAGYPRINEDKNGYYNWKIKNETIHSVKVKNTEVILLHCCLIRTPNTSRVLIKLHHIQCWN